MPLAFLPGGRAAAMAGMVAPVGGNTYQKDAEGRLTKFGESARMHLTTNGMPATQANIKNLADATNELRGATEAPAVPSAALAELLRAELVRTGKPADPGAVQRAYDEVKPALDAAIKRRPRQ